MDDYVNEVIAAAKNNDSEGMANSPAADHLYMVNNSNPQLLNEEDKQHFHTMTAKLLFLSKPARPDIQQAVAGTQILMMKRSLPE